MNIMIVVVVGGWGGFVCALWLICERQNRRSTNTPAVSILVVRGISTYCFRPDPLRRSKRCLALLLTTVALVRSPQRLFRCRKQ